MPYYGWLFIFSVNRPLNCEYTASTVQSVLKYQRSKLSADARAPLYVEPSKGAENIHFQLFTNLFAAQTPETKPANCL